MRFSSNSSIRKTAVLQKNLKIYKYAGIYLARNLLISIPIVLLPILLHFRDLVS